MAAGTRVESRERISSLVMVYLVVLVEALTVGGNNIRKKHGLAA
jgi:hypothetical protein